MVFRFAFNAKDNKVKKLASAISSQWKVAIIDTKVANKVAYVSICKKDINTNVTQYVTVGNNKFKNLSFSAKVAKSLAYRLDNVEKEIIEIRTTLQKLVKSMAAFNNKKSDNLNNSKSVDKFNKAFKDVNRRIDLLSQPTARHVKGNGSKNGRSKIFLSNYNKGDKSAGLATIVKKSHLYKVLTFIEHVKGRLSEIILDHTSLGVVRVFNWYGPANDKILNRVDFMNNAASILESTVKAAMLHNERVMILGDINATVNTFWKKNLSAHEKIFLSLCKNLKLFDIAPKLNEPSHQQRNKHSLGKSRPDHILSTHYDHLEFVRIILTSQKSSPNTQSLKLKTKEINLEFINSNPQTLLDVQKSLSNIVNKFGQQVNHKPKLISSSKEVLQLQKCIYDLKRCNNLKHASSFTKNYLEHNFSSENVQNKLQLANPYSYAFRKELNSSSIAGIVKHSHNKVISTHFEAMFNSEQKTTKRLPDITANKQVKKWSFSEIEVKSLANAIKKTKNSMAGYDNITVPLLKTLTKQSLEILAKAINLAIKNESIPKELGIGILLPLPKSNTPTALSDFRPIVVLSVLYRLFSTTINKQFMDILERAGIIHPAQRGFMRKGSTIDHLITMRTAIAHKIQQKQEIFTMALDIKNAYGSVIHKRLISILRKHGFKKSVLNLITSMVDCSVIKVLINNKLSSPFNAKVGVPQGDPLSPALFNVYINSTTNTQQISEEVFSKMWSQ